MFPAPLPQRYSFEAIDWNGQSQKVGYVATSEEDALAQLAAWRFREPRLLDARPLRGKERPEVALHEALKDPMVGPDWLPHLWAIPASVAFTPRSSKSLRVRFARGNRDFTLAQPHIRINLRPNGGVRVGVGSADLLRQLDPETPRVMEQLGWQKPQTKYYRDYYRIFAPGWNLTFCLHKAIHALAVATGIGPNEWFTMDTPSLAVPENFRHFEHVEEDGKQIYRVPPGGIEGDLEVSAGAEPHIHLPAPAPVAATTVTARTTDPAGLPESESSNMTDSSYTALLFIVDRSGSMRGIRDDMVGGLSTILEQQKAQPGLLTVDVVTFDDRVEFTHKMANPDSVEVTLEPRGGTALHDAIGMAVNDFAERIDALPEHAKPQTIQVVVVTDGHENQSVEYSSEQVRQLISEKQADQRWDFVFLGANQDAVTTGGRLGFREDAAMTFSPRGSEIGHATASMSRYINDRRRGQRQGFTGEERARSEGQGQ